MINLVNLSDLKLTELRDQLRGELEAVEKVLVIARRRFAANGEKELSPTTVSGSPAVSQMEPGRFFQVQAIIFRRRNPLHWRDCFKRPCTRRLSN